MILLEIYLGGKNIGASVSRVQRALSVKYINITIEVREETYRGEK